MEPTPTVNRRTVLAGAGTVTGTALIASCGGKDSSGYTAAAPASPSASSSSSSTSSSGSAAAGPLAKLADVPVGSAVAAKTPDGKPVIVAQPRRGTAAAFSAICTHMGCTVAPAGRQLHCPCHGSVYDASTGHVISGPAPRPLPPYPVHVSNGNVLPGPA